MSGVGIILERLLEETKKTRIAIEKLLTIHEGRVPTNITIAESELLTLPDHIRKSYLVILENKRPLTASEVAEKTGRARAAESMYLNQLVVMRKLVKSREGHTQYFLRGIQR